jgi:hypothetical protein
MYVNISLEVCSVAFREAGMRKEGDHDDVIEILDSDLGDLSPGETIVTSSPSSSDDRLPESRNSLSYLDQLERIIYTVMESESHLFDEEECQIIAMYKSLPSELSAFLAIRSHDSRCI